MKHSLSTFAAVAFLLIGSAMAVAQADVTVRIELPPQKSHVQTVTNAVLWLEPVNADLKGIAWPTGAPYRLMQKNRTFFPHLLVVPVGASVAFPNADPYFHNVFSLFEGSRFDLGLYEAGSTRNVRFTRKGVSYIFCNIHPEMGAVVISLDTPLWTSLTNSANLTISDVPKGTYEVNLWVEGQEAARLSHWKHPVTVAESGVVNAGTFQGSAQSSAEHTDKFGNPYKRDGSPY